MASIQSIVKNTSYLSAAYVGQKLLSFLYFTLIARIAGVVDTGSYVFALSYATIFAVFVDFGLAQYIQREIAQEKDDIKTLTQKTLGLKTFYSIFAVLLGVVVLHFMQVDALTQMLVYVAMGVMLVDSFNLTLWSVFRGKHRLSFESVGIILTQVVTFIVGITALWIKASVVFLIIALLAGSIITALFAFIAVKRVFKFWAIPAFSHFSLKQIKGAASFGFANVFTRIFASIDSVILRQLVGPAAVGFYSIPNKLVFAAQFIPAAFSAAIYPAMSYYFVQDKEKMMQVFSQAMLFLLILSVPMAVGLFVLAEPLVVRVFTEEFAPSVIGVQVLVWGIIFGFIEFPLGALIAAIDEQRKNTITRAIVMIVNIVLNLILIPLYSFVGACIAALISYVVLVVMGIYWVHTSLHPDWSALRKASLQVVFSALMMGAVVWLAVTSIPLLASIILGVIVYGLLVYLLGLVTPEAIRQILLQFKRS